MKRFSSFLSAAALSALTLSSTGCTGEKTGQDCNIVWLCDKHAGQSISLFPDADTALLDSLGLKDKNEIPSSMSAFLLRKDSLNILFDTGYGLPEGGVRKGLDSLGIEPEDIDYIYLTHFHGDHIGGMLDNTGKAYYPEAQVYASQAEYDAWMNMPAERNTQAVNTMSAYEGRINLFNPDDTLPGDIIAINAFGHTPGHTAFRTGDILIWGDVIHGISLQLAHPEICAVYDMDKKASVETRIRMINYAKDNHLLVAGMHLPEGFLDFRIKAN